MPYQVKIAVFEGPLDLLLQLIERQELDITKVALAQVADQYLEYISLLPEVDPAILADFLVIAARLLLIKSLALLPKPPMVVEEEHQEDDGDLLVEQLAEYKRFKEAAGFLRGREESGMRCYVRSAPPPKMGGSLRQGEISLADLTAAFRSVSARSAQGEPQATVAPLVFSLKDKIALIREILLRQGKAIFQALLAQATCKVEAIVTFLALLELLKNGQVTAYQESTFGEIIIVPGPNGLTTPKGES